MDVSNVYTDTRKRGRKLPFAFTVRTGERVETFRYMTREDAEEARSEYTPEEVTS